MARARMALKKKTTPKPRDDEDDDFSSRIRPIGDIDRPRSWVIYGKSGTGKTTLASTFPKPLLHVDVKDEGTDSIADVSGVFATEVNNWEDFEELYYFLKNHPKKYKTVVIDTVTMLQQLCLEHIKPPKDGKRVGDWGSMTMRDWGAASGLLKDWIINFRDLPMEVVFIAQEKVAHAGDEDEDPDNMIAPEVGPSVMKSVASVLNAAVSAIGSTFIGVRHRTVKVKGKSKEVQQIKYCLRVGPHPIYVTKIRKPRDIEAPAIIENATYEDWVGVIKGE